MTNEEMQKRMIIILQNLDELSRTGGMELKGLSAVQKMAGCAGVLQEMLDSLEKKQAVETSETA